jgi:hypothetical protein
MEAIHSCETFVHTEFTQNHITEDGIIHSHRCENLRSYIIFYLTELAPLVPVLLKNGWLEV